MVMKSSIKDLDGGMRNKVICPLRDPPFYFGKTDNWQTNKTPKSALRRVAVMVQGCKQEKKGRF